jgi:hypothetical protein
MSFTENGLMPHDHQTSILEIKIQDAIPTCMGYLRLKLGIVNAKCGKIYHSSGKGSVNLGTDDNLGPNQVNCSNLRLPIRCPATYK